MATTTFKRKPRYQVFACFWHSTTSPLQLQRKLPAIHPTPRVFHKEPFATHPYIGLLLGCMWGSNLDFKPSALLLVSLAWLRVMLLTLPIGIFQPLLSQLLWTFNHPPVTGCSPTSWALSRHEPDCQSCNISGIFLQIQSDIFFGHKEKWKR